MNSKLVKEVQNKLEGGVADEEVTAIIINHIFKKDMSMNKEMHSLEKRVDLDVQQTEVHKTAQKEQQKKHPDDKIEEKKKRSKPAEKGKRTVDDQSSNSEADKKGAMSKTKKKKITKALEAISENKIIDDLQSELEQKQLLELDLLERELEDSQLSKQSKEMDVAGVIEATRNVLFPEPPAEQPASWQPTPQNNSSAVWQPTPQNTCSASWQPSPQLSACTGCLQLSQRVQSLEENVGWLWNQVHQLQKQVPQSPSPWWQSGMKSHSVTTATATLSTDDSSLSVVTASPTVISPSMKDFHQSVCSRIDTPSFNTQPSTGNTVTSTPDTQILAKDTEESGDVQSPKGQSIKCPDDSVIFNGYTVAQLKIKARQKGTYSRACKVLFETMFNKEEIEGRSLEGYCRRKQDGTISKRDGLEDQNKLFALQEIVRTEYPMSTPRKIRRKLAEKLKPSAQPSHK